MVSQVKRASKISKAIFPNTPQPWENCQVENRAATPAVHPVEKFPEPWLFDTEALLKELDRVRELILMIPLHQDTFGPTDTAVRAVWGLQERLRYLLQL